MALNIDLTSNSLSIKACFLKGADSSRPIRFAESRVRHVDRATTKGEGETATRS